MRVYVVDNGGQWTHREWRVLRDLGGAETRIVPNTVDSHELDGLDGLVLSGGGAQAYRASSPNWETWAGTWTSTATLYSAYASVPSS